MNNPYVNINRVIDGTPDQRRVVDFLHIRSISNPFTIPATGFTTVAPGSDINGASYYQFSDLQLESKLRLTHVPMIIIEKNVDTTLDKDNFSTCYIKNVGGEPKLFLWSKEQMVAGTVTIVSIILFEAGTTLAANEITRGLTNGAGSGSGTISLSDVEYDAATLISYLNQLGNVAGDVDQIQQFLTGLSAGITTRSLTADFIKAGTVDATKMTIHGPNIITSFDSFEQFGGKSLIGTTTGLTPTSFGLLSANVINTQKYHGDHSLRIQVDTGAAGWIYLNPYTFNRQNWITITKPGRYILSFYEKCPSALINVETGKVSLVDVTVPGTPVEKTFRTIIGTGSGAGTEGFTRRHINFNVADVIPATETEPLIPAEATEDDPLLLTLKVDLNAGSICYLDAIQLEEAETATSAPYPFASGGTTVISGDSIITGTIDAQKVTVDNLKADKITSGFINAARIAANTITGEMIIAGAITADKAIIADAAIFNGMIRDLTASKLTAGTINAAEINMSQLDELGNPTGILDITGSQITFAEMLEDAILYKRVQIGRVIPAFEDLTIPSISYTSTGTDTIIATLPNVDLIFTTANLLTISGSSTPNLNGTWNVFEVINSLSFKFKTSSIVPAGTYTDGVSTYTEFEPYYGILIRDQENTALIGSQGFTKIGMTQGLANLSKGRVDAVLTGAVIQDNTIKGAALVAQAISADKILAGTITAVQIAAGTITADQIAANTITVDELATNVGSTLNITGNTIIQSLSQDLEEQGLRYAFTNELLKISIPGQAGSIEMEIIDNVPKISLSDGSGSTPVTTIESGKMNVDTMVVLSSITIGQHKISKYEISAGNYITIFQQI